MKLVSFQIKNYKIIDDTGPVPVERVTAFIGKNESGKTAVLKALWKTRNVADTTFDKFYDYPRDRYSSDQNGRQEVTRLEFKVSPEAADDLKARLLLAPAPERVIYTTFYVGEDKIAHEVQFDKNPVVGLSGADVRSVVEKLRKKISLYRTKDATSVVSAAHTALKQLSEKAPIWNQAATIKALEALDSACATWIKTNPSHNAAVRNERQALHQLLVRARQGDPTPNILDWAEKNLPSFIYFDDYGRLDARIHLPAYLKHNDRLDPKIRTQTALFEWSGIDPEKILTLGSPRQNNETEAQVQRRHEQRPLLLDAASSKLTENWTEWWPEKRHKLHFAAEGEYLTLTVSDQDNTSPVPFGERSNGFQWFFSFSLVFLVESHKAHKGSILLLDEPGLHLHPALQTKLLGLFEHISEDNQILYSTHLPFLVDGNHLERVRTVHLSDTDPHKTIVSNHVRPTGDHDTLFPIQAALGYSIAQTLFLGKRSVIVEGITDYWFIKALNDCLSTLDGKPLLHEDTILIPAYAPCLYHGGFNRRR